MFIFLDEGERQIHRADTVGTFKASVCTCRPPPSPKARATGLLSCPRYPCELRTMTALLEWKIIHLTLYFIERKQSHS